ncbi:GspE/PulE family protein [Effusibacillus lacus]|uniref:Type II secretion system protein GspE n=1 Tax=Effusibacillus lacus TaxID=1348429 RepID=A0A292YPM1_9BACL|nr:GspE/PulE family protein [Effusibacillus lacus]TCS72580.1 type II secretory ATPase GspE/PulE/Tfp pilus assembly ATPase PilB-like protein [Effusibacillus lacus]GAX90861.1 type II secretion system protein GspE [Effusibacillus lacus]
MSTVLTLDWVEYVIDMAVRMEASDIHIEPTGREFEVRFRIDGDLQRPPQLPSCDISSVQRIKVLAEMDIAERRLPQDGSFQVQTQEGTLDIRVSTLPTVEGEKVVMRLHRHSQLLQQLEQLRMGEGMLLQFQSLLSQLRGMIIATGPTGSGKSTTLLAALRYLHSRHLNIVTLEDPVESRIPGVHQVQINERAGLTFARGLRSILRQDPDVIMVGEIRDGETAGIAVRAALTGHLVLTTLHTDTAEGALIRLVDLGVERYLAAAAVKGVLAQRLVRCTDGGRRGVFDLLPVTSEVQEWLLNGSHSTQKPVILKQRVMQNTLRNLILQGEVQADEYKKLFGGDVQCSTSAADGEATANSPDFVHEWADSCGAALPSMRA